MRTRFFIGMVVLALAVIVLLFWLRPAKPSKESAPTPAQSAQSPIPQTNLQPASPPAVVSQTSANPVTTAGPSTATNNVVESHDLKIKQIVEGGNVPVCFYGMVIDQDSNALSGVRVKLGVRHNMYLIPNSLEAAKYAALSQEETEKMLNPTKEVMTDANGRFQWVDPTVTGDIVGVGSLTKDGYEAEPGQYSCGAGGGSFDNPVIFKMWSTNIHEKLIIGNDGFKIVPDGRPYFINLTDNTISESGTGDLKVWIQYTNHIVSGQIPNWSAGIEVINGGLLGEPQGTVMFEAPASGYVPSFQQSGQISEGERGQTGEQQFYLQLQNGNEYGQMTIDLLAPFNVGIPGLIRLSYAINPSGSRILR